MERTGISHLAGRRARTLSGGEQRRVSLARALALEPRVLFLDEPFAALDAPTHRSLLADLPGWLREAGCAAVLVTHDSDDVLHLAETVAVIMDGRIRQIDAVDDVFARPADADVAAFLGVENILTGEALPPADGVARVRVGDSVLIVEGRPNPGSVTLMIHPEAIALRRAEAVTEAEEYNTLVCRVVSVEPAGRQVRVLLDAGFPLVALVSRATSAEFAVTPGLAVTALLKPAAIHVASHL
jgi:ABC-type sulfate/molybdate transport systems ATPase subunit